MSGEEKHPVMLCAEDAAAVDAMVEGKAGEEARGARVRAWAGAVRAGCAEGVPAGLLEKTLGAVQSERMKISGKAHGPVAAGSGEERVPVGWMRRYWREASAGLVAACILAAVMVPMIQTARLSAQREACAGNLGLVSNALGMYAADFSGALPSVAVPADGNWMPRGPGYRPTSGVAGSYSNAANLLPLVNASYMGSERLMCPGRTSGGTKVDLSLGDVPEEVRGYSYVNMFGAERPRMDGKRSTIILADRNPLFGSKAVEDPAANSWNHQLRGNYVVRGDKSVSWETTPNVGVGGDNIWTIGVERKRVYTGTETVRSLADSFLAP